MNNIEREKAIKNFQRGLLTAEMLELRLQYLDGQISEAEYRERIRPLLDAEDAKWEARRQAEREQADEQAQQPQPQGLTLEQKKKAKILAGSVLLGIGLTLYLAWTILFIFAPELAWGLASVVGLIWVGLFCGNVAFGGFGAIIDARNDIVDDIEG